MSILIKGMEMPTCCYECQMAKRNGINIICPVAHEQFSVADTNILYHRLDNCPLVPVPPHGDLIDRYWLIDIALHLMNTAKNDDIANGVKWLWQYIIDTPAIIPASKEETP